MAEKESIGEVAAGLIEDRQSVIIDAGTTAFHVARHLEGRTLQIVTNSLPVANLFASAPSIEVVVSGGVIYPRLGVLVGPLAVETFSKTHADVAIMSGGGITVEGVTNSHGLLIDIQRAMIRAASRVIFCFDHTKLGRRSVAHLCDLSSIDTIVTDNGAPNDLIAELRGKGLEVVVTGNVDRSVLPPDGTFDHEQEPGEERRRKKRPEPIPTPSSGDLSGGMSWD